MQYPLGIEANTRELTTPVPVNSPFKLPAQKADEASKVKLFIDALRGSSARPQAQTTDGFMGGVQNYGQPNANQMSNIGSGIGSFFKK